MQTPPDVEGRIGGATPKVAILIPEEWNPDGWDELRRATVSDNVFDFKDVAPGAYTVVAIYDTNQIPQPEEDPDFVQMLQDVGEHIELGPGDSKQTTLAVTVRPLD